MWGATGLVLLIVCLPSLLTRSPLRHWLVGGVLQREGIDLQIEQVRAGWVTPLQIRRATLGPVGKPTLIAVDEIESDRTLLSALFEGVQVGELLVQHPQVHIWVDNEGSNLDFPAVPFPNDGSLPLPTTGTGPSRHVAITIQDAELWLKTKTMSDEANVFRDFDITGRLIQADQRRTLSVAPGRLLDYAPLSTVLCDGLLKYLVPVLSEATWVNGELSLDLARCEIDIDRPKDSQLAGQLTVHGVRAGVKNKLIAAAGARLASVTGRQGSNVIYLADEAIVSFEVHDGAVWHDGVEFGLPRVSPDFVVRTSGSVGFDDTLDLKIEIPFAAHFLRDGALANAVQNTTLILNATGTIQHPHIELDDESLFANIVSRFRDGKVAEQDQPIKNLILGIRDAVLQQQETNPAPDATRHAASKESRNEADQAASDDQAANQKDEVDNADAKSPETPILDRLRDRLRNGGGILRRRNTPSTQTD